MYKLHQNVIANYSIVLKGSTAQIKKAVDLLDNVIDDQDCFLEYLDAYRERLRAENRINCVGRKTQPKRVEKRYSWDKYVEDDEDDEEERLPKHREKRYSWDKYVEDDEDFDYEEDDDYEDERERCPQAYDNNNNVHQIVEEHFDVIDTTVCVWTEDIFQLANDLAYYSPDISFSISGCTIDFSEDIEDMIMFEVEYSNKKLTTRETCWYICVQMHEFSNYEAFAKIFTDRRGNPRYTEEDYLGFLNCADKWYVLESGQGEFSVDVPFGDTVRVKIRKPKKGYL